MECESPVSLQFFRERPCMLEVHVEADLRDHTRTINDMMCGERLWSATSKNCFEDKESFGIKIAILKLTATSPSISIKVFYMRM